MVPAAARRAHAEQIERSLVLLRSLHQTVTDLLDDLTETRSPAGTARDLTRKMRELETAVKDAREMEKRLDAIDQSHDDDSGHTIDFERVREQLLARLDRLAAERDEGAAHGGDDAARSSGDGA